MSRSQFDNVVKDRVREELFKDLPKKIKSFLTLPGPDCLCIKHLLKNGVITPKTHIWFVEKIKDYISDINRKLNQLKLEACYWDIALHKTSLYECPIFDVAFIDCCGQLTPQIEKWIENQLFGGVDEDSPLFYTFIGYPERYQHLRFQSVPINRMHYLRGICKTFGNIDTTFPNTNVCYQVANRLWEIHSQKPTQFIMHKAPKAKYTMVSLEF